MNSKLFIKFFIAIIAVGAFFRLSKLGQVPVSLYWDETAILVDAKSVAETGLDMHARPWYQLIFPSYGDYKLPVYIWFSAIAINFFGATNWSVRITSAIAGILTVILSGLIARQLFKNSEHAKVQIIQLSTMVVMALAPWSIIFSRTGFEGHLAQFFLACSVAALLYAQKHLSAFYNNHQSKIIFVGLLLLSIFFGTISTYTYFSVRFVWPVVSIVVWLLYWSKYLKIKIRPKKWWLQIPITLLAPLLVFSATLIPMTSSPLYEESNQFRLSTTSIFNGFDYALMSNQLREQAGNTFIDRLFFHRHLLLIKELARNYFDHLNLNYLFLSGDNNLRHGTGQHGLFLLGSLPIFIYGLIKLWTQHKRVWLTLIIWWLAALLPASVPETTPHALRSLNALVPISIVIGFGLSELIAIFRRKSHHQMWRSVVITIIFLNLLSFTHFANHYFNHYPKDSAYAWQDSYTELALLIAENKDQMSEVWVSGVDGRFYLWLLAYDPKITPQQIQALPKENFQISKINNIYFAPFDWQKLNSNTFKTLAVGETDYMENQLLESKVRPNWFKNIKDHAGKTRFIVASFGE